MKRYLCLFLVLLFLFAALTACGVPSAPADDPDPGTGSETEQETEQEIPDEAEYVEDFSVTTIDGGTFTLSEALKDHELVLINLFATWCGPCQMEFPYMQEAWSQRSDEVAVVALSVDPDDTEDMLKDFAAYFGMTFPVASGTQEDVLRFCDGSIPTTILVGENGRVLTVEVGAKTSTQAFLDLFDGYTGEDFDPSLCTYELLVFNTETNAAVEGAVINFCTDTTCTPVTTDQDGTAYFTGVPARYHVQVIQLPEGLQIDSESSFGISDFYTEPYSETYMIACRGE